MTLRMCLCGLFVLVTLPIGAGERLALRVTPAVAFAPADLVVRTMVEADSANRAMEIVAESADFYRASEIELDGERAPRTTSFEFRGLPPGTYVVTAVLFGADGHARAQVRAGTHVVESGQR